MSLESEVCSVVWSLPLQLDTDTRQNLRALCMLSDAASDATVALVCTLFPTPDEESDAARTPSSQIVLCIPLDARGRPLDAGQVVGQSSRGGWLLGHPVFMPGHDASFALLADADFVHSVNRHGRAQRIAAAPNCCEFQAAPLHLPGVAEGEMLAIAAVERTGLGVLLPGMHYQLWRIHKPRWLASLPVISWIPSCRSISSVLDLDQDGRAEVFIASVESASDDSTDGIWETLTAAPTELFALPAAMFDAPRQP
jgi:hypothetical protein